MSILDLSSLNLNETFEPEVIPAGEEVNLRIINVNTGTNKNGKPYLMPFFEAPEYPYLKEFGDYMELPNRDMDAKALNKAKLKILSFLNAFDLDTNSNLDVETLKGHTGYAILGVGKDQDGEPINRINKYVAGR